MRITRGFLHQVRAGVNEAFNWQLANPLLECTNEYKYRG